jgi:vacuolar-type H+-ATPase subunit H
LQEKWLELPMVNPASLDPAPEAAKEVGGLESDVSSAKNKASAGISSAESSIEGDLSSLESETKSEEQSVANGISNAESSVENGVLGAERGLSIGVSNAERAAENDVAGAEHEVSKDFDVLGSEMKGAAGGIANYARNDARAFEGGVSSKANYEMAILKNDEQQMFSRLAKQSPILGLPWSTIVIIVLIAIAVFAVGFCFRKQIPRCITWTENTCYTISRPIVWVASGIDSCLKACTYPIKECFVGSYRRCRSCCSPASNTL